MKTQPQTTLLGLDLEELTRLAQEAEQPAYRGRQLFEALYVGRVTSVEQISTLPKSFRSRMGDLGLAVGSLGTERKFLSRDGTVRYLLGLEDTETVETVWMPEGDGGEEGDGTDASERGWRRATICVSSQVGCAVNCQFCLTARLGIRRNLSAGEIVGQVLAVLHDQQVSPPLERVNLVFMGMGEPLLNYENFVKAVRILVAGVGIPESRMTVSTAGIVPRIYDLGGEAVRPKLAISLTAANDELRSRLMPLNRKWNLPKLMLAAREFPLRNREKLTCESVLLRGTNDSREHARQLAELVRGMRAKVNLIALTPGPGVEFQTPDERIVLAFQQVLMASGIPAFVRRPRGRDIYAACGQLKRMVETST
jgi:23S rRNA (adenine2503-C2)-methyltransferase